MDHRVLGAGAGGDKIVGGGARPGRSRIKESTVEIDLRLTAPGWVESPQAVNTSGADDAAVIMARADHPCPDPVSPAALRDHPGRLAAVRVEEERVVLAVDRLRSWPLFWTVTGRGDDRRLLVADSTEAVLGALDDPVACVPALEELQDAGFVTGPRTFLEDIHQVEQGAVVTVDRSTGRPVQDDYAFFRYTDDEIDDPEIFGGLFLEALDKTMGRLLERTAGRRLVIPLSGGLDSRLLVAWLRLHGVEDVLTFTYGLPGSREMAVSQSVARSAGYPWHGVEIGRAALLEVWHSERTAAFLRQASALSALPHVQDWYALCRLMDDGVLQRGDVVLPGHTIVGNMHDEGLLDALPVSRATVARALLRHHHSLRGRAHRAERSAWTAPPVRRALTLGGMTAPTTQPAANAAAQGRAVRSVIEGYNIRERQTKYINNSMRAYEQLGLEWALPMLDVEMWQAWARGSAALTVSRSFYQSVIDNLWARVTGQEAAGYFQVTRVPATTRSRLRSGLEAAHLLGAAERGLSAWASLHSPMGFDALVTDMPRPLLAARLLGGWTVPGAWARSFTRDTWCEPAHLFGDLAGPA